MRRLKVALSLTATLLGLGLWSAALSHEVRPAFLEVTELANNHFDILWKQPSMGSMAVHLVPHISGGLLDAAPTTLETTPDFEIRQWRNVSTDKRGLEGRTLAIEGLDRTITDVLVSIKANGDSTEHVLLPQHPSLTLHLDPARSGAWDFLTLGIRHILTGPDHLLFVLGLLLIVRDRWMLLKTVSAFTLAHSVTLAVATLAEIRLSTPLLDALIALSILFIAPEALRAQRGGTSFTIRYPWVVAFAFGMLHGMGFATGLMPLGLAKSALLSALVLFNVGVEAGQLLFIASVLTLARARRAMDFRWPQTVELAPTYLIGSLGAFWTLQNCVTALGVS